MDDVDICCVPSDILSATLQNTMIIIMMISMCRLRAFHQPFIVV
jgi:hypothetical protein